MHFISIAYIKPTLFRVVFCYCGLSKSLDISLRNQKKGGGRGEMVLQDLNVDRSIEKKNRFPRLFVPCSVEPRPTKTKKKQTEYRYYHVFHSLQ